MALIADPQSSPNPPAKGKETMSIDKALATAQSEVPECVAVGYVDMVSGLLLAVKTVDSHPSEVLDLVAAATGDLFQGKNVMEIEKLFDKSRGITRPTVRTTSTKSWCSAPT
jgi:hypothetical protein